TEKARQSGSKEYDPGLSKISFSPEKPETTISFSRETQFEIFDKHGNLVKTGSGKSIDVSELKSGDKYYLNYDNSFGETFTKK
ncbi:MAG: hypothetical protein AAGC47_15995, partial [Bacteroidota bacterium]